ncbi:MAG TPA: phytanoyl-CoA dioxygenase family protein [Acidimicrobiales bacterium]|nr:phytanoyl-CoA dioxygenase family protein [Acidimicrobiales bacterium]
MSIDARSRQERDVVRLDRDDLFDRSLPGAVERHGDLAARGCAYLGLPSLGLEVGGRAVTIAAARGGCALRTGTTSAGVVAVLEADALSDLLQDVASTMGLAMSSRVKITKGSINDWIRWEPVLRALYDGRKVHEAGDIDFEDADGGELDLDRTFAYGDDRQEMVHFLEQAGFLHLRRVFDEDEMAALGADIDEWIARASPDDGQSWWATDDQGRQQAVRVLNFQEKSEVLPLLLADARLQWLTELTGDDHVHSGNAEGLVKPLGIVRGLSDLPWHKDCGQGKHSYMCNSMTCGISVTGADRSSGALGVIPGSHRANTMATGRDPSLDLQPRMLETSTGDVTVHCSDTLHRAHPPVERPRKVVYTSFPLPPLEGDQPVKSDPKGARAARAALSDVQSRIEAADNEASSARYRAGQRR